MIHKDMVIEIKMHSQVSALFIRIKIKQKKIAKNQKIHIPPNKMKLQKKT